LGIGHSTLDVFSKRNPGIASLVFGWHFVPAMPEHPPAPPTFREALRYWLRLGFISFGGPAGQIAIMHRELVDERHWIGETHFLHALNFCMLLPGPEAQQLATYLGWRLHGWRGGIAAGTLFVLPSAFILFALSWVYIQGGSIPWIAAIFYGLLPAVMAIVASALLRIGRRALKTAALWMLAAASFVAICFFKISFVAILAGAALIGWLGNRLSPRHFPTTGRHVAAEPANEAPALVLPPTSRATWTRALGITLLCVTLWWTPIFAVGRWLGWSSTPFAQGVFFSQAALITFGGAYAVLPYVAQQAVERYAWLSHAQMMGGLALAETTPGPLIMVLQFVGFVGGWQHPGALEPWQGAALGAAVTTWATFVPCFLFVFLGAPHIERLQDRPALAAAMTGITAAVVGVILNLTVWFAWHALWPAEWHAAALLGGIDWFVAFVSLAAFAAMERWKVGVVPVIAACAALGILWRLTHG
jgi:chromate transporter